MDIPNQLPNGLFGDASQQVEDGKLNGRQRSADGNAVVPEIKAVDENLFQEQVQVPRILADEERLQVMEENRVESIQPAMPHRNAFGAVTRTHSTQEIVLIPKQFKGLNNDRGGERFSF